MEPFLENPPRRRKRKQTRRRGKPRGHRRGCRCVVCARRGGRKARRRTRRYRANVPYATVFGGAMNPRKRRRRGGKRRHTRRRHYRRNPGGGRGIVGDFKAILPAVGWGLAGYTGMAVVPGTLGRFVPMPKKEENAAMYYGAKILVALGLSWAVGRFINRQAGRQVLTGSVLTVGAEALNQFALAPMGLQTYLPDSMGEDTDVGTYLPGSQPLGYLSPGVTVDDMGDEDTLVTRLDPNRRF